MKLIATASQTVGPFFSIGLAHLHQDATKINSDDAQTITGTVVDGDGQPIPDCVLEFWTPNSFARVPTSAAGEYSVILGAGTGMCEVLLFMRGLLRPVYTRVYLSEAAKARDEITSKLVPRDRVGTLMAQPGSAAKQFVWNVKMQGDNETVFFDY
jgi:protocatechuate 3,4-dioxygenase alpha subunit